MSKVKYSEIEKKRPGGRHVWGVLQMEGRCQEGHEWEGRADGIIYSGKWCPVCGLRRDSKAQLRFEF